MCVVIDADTFSEIVDEENIDFKPLRKWINEEEHDVIYGGSTYAKHLSNHGRFRSYLIDLERSGRTHQENKRDVDGCEELLKINFVSTNYNDHHIAAILFVSGCKVVSSHDRGLHQLIKDCCSDNGKSMIYSNMPTLSINNPRIYQYKRHESMLRCRYVSRCCT